jgi:hypothetical protein
MPRVINVDKNPAYAGAVTALKANGTISRRFRLRQCKYLNNMVEQDHRNLKRRTWLAKGYGSLQTAWRTLHGMEAMEVDVRLIQPPAPVCPSQVRTTALIHFRTEHLNPSPNAAGRNCQSTLRCHLPPVDQRNRISQIPSDAPQNNLAAIVPPLEGIRCGDGQHLPYQPEPLDFATEPSGHNVRIVSSHCSSFTRKRRGREYSTDPNCCTRPYGPKIGMHSSPLAVWQR